MKEHELLDAVGGIDKELIENADAAVKAKKKTGSRFLWIAAAAACLLIGAGVAVPILARSARNGEAKLAQEQPEGVFIPAVELEEPSDGAVARSMIPLVVYKGHIYTQAEEYFGEDAKPLETLVGERIGTAKGNINEWYGVHRRTHHRNI